MYSPFPTPEQVKQEAIADCKERLALFTGDYKEKKFLQERLRELTGYVPFFEMGINNFGKLEIKEI